MIKLCFKEMINNIDQFNNDYSLYAKDLPLKSKDEILLNEERYEIPDTIENFNYVIGIDQIKSIIRNLNMQNLKKYDHNLYTRAINYYIENDAFIDLEHNTKE